MTGNLGYPDASVKVIAFEIRSLTVGDSDEFRKHLVRLTNNCRCSRFGGVMTDASLRAYAERTNYANTHVLAYQEQGQLRGIAELRSLCVTWGREAEAAFSVELPWRGRGIGTALMQEIVGCAQSFGVQDIYLNCHPHNRPMQRIAEKFNAQMRFEGRDCMIHIAVAPIQSGDCKPSLAAGSLGARHGSR